MAFRPVTALRRRWRPKQALGLEHLDLRVEGDRIVVRSVVIGEQAGEPFAATYRVTCRRDWTVLFVQVDTAAGRQLRLSTDSLGRWGDDGGRRLPEFDGCIDVDLACTPFTNTLPLRRLEPRPDTDPVELSVLYVPFPSLEPFVDGQRYRCLEPDRRYRYEAVDGTFAADLEVDADGFVVDYPDLFERIPVE